jgi:hypothetical protein
LKSFGVATVAPPMLLVGRSNCAGRTVHLSLDFVFTPSDCLQLASYRRARWALAVRRVVAVGVLVFALRHLLIAGIDWKFVLYIVLALFIAVPFVITRIIMCGALAIWRPTIRVSIDDDGISVRSEENKQDIP